MTDTTLKNAMFGVNPALSAAANKQKSVQNTANNTQDFGTVLGKTAQKLEKPKQSAADNAKSQTKQPDKTTSAAKENESAQNTASTRKKYI